MKKEREIDFMVADHRLALQVSYSLKDDETRRREVEPLFCFRKKHPDWTAAIITYDEYETIEKAGISIRVVPAWKWLLE